MLNSKKREFISFMLASDVLKFGSFVTKSGRHSPYFVNTGNYRMGAQIDRLGQTYATLVTQFCGKNFDAIFGPAYKGIPLATTLAATLARDYDVDRPYFFNRKESKDHGEGGNFVGYQPIDGARIIIVEDVITAGTAIREVMPQLKRTASVVVKEMFISVNRCEIGSQNQKTATMEIYDDFGIQVHSIVTVFDLYDYLNQEAIYSNSLLTAMGNYMDQYCRRDHQ